MNTNKVAPHLLFDKLFTIKSLQDIFESKIKAKQSKGIDRINPRQFSQQLKKHKQKHLKIIKYKCIEKTYRFSPYVEIIKQKGRNKVPRVISVPTVRDRIVLYALKAILDSAFKDCIRRKLANTYIHDIQKAIKDVDPESLFVISTDIKQFYDSINRKILIEKISTKIRSKKILVLIEQAISTPSVPKNYRKNSINNYKTVKGIPQGLSISNILADIYVSEYIDKYIKENYPSCHYFRYVDDILIVGQKECMDGVEDLIEKRLKDLRLTNHPDKTFSNTGDKPFEYLGYRFELPKITVRQSTIDKFIASIAAKFSDYIHNKSKRLKDKDYLNEDKLKEVFLIELNEKITGAISKTKRYGWIFYFHAINDLSLLHRTDTIISKFFKRLDDFNNTPPTELKKLSRAYYEVRDPRRVNNGYIHNYNQYHDVSSQKIFLDQRGYIDPKIDYSDSDIKKMYQRVKSRNLSQLEKDDANMY